MEEDRFKRLQTVFAEALTLDPGTREAFVRETCGDDPALAEEALQLLEHEARVGDARTVRPAAEAFAAFEAAELRSLIGREIDRYRLETEIASGGMGRVFKARRTDQEVEQVVALKLMREELFNPALLERFSTERRILAALNHPGIAHLIDAGTDERGTPFVAMEYVDGLPLVDYCAAHRLSIKSRVRLFRQILDAVSYAHRNLVVHRDLKPANVLVTPEGRVKLLDFGIAKALDSDHERTITAERFFTPAYAAPEQLRGEPAAVSCDVYALGAILYLLLAGATPFDLSAVGAAEAERLILTMPPEPMRLAAIRRGARALEAQGVDDPARWAGQLSGDLENIVQKALRKEAHARYPSVEQFDADLARYLDHLPVSASRAGWLYRGRKFFERNALAVSFAAIAGMVAIGGLGYIAKQNNDIRSERDRAQIALQVLKNSFKAANPASPGGRNYSQARVMLKAAAREVSALEKRQPSLFRDLASEIAEIQLNLGLNRDGLALIQRANRAGTGPSDGSLFIEIHALIRNRELEQARKLLESHRARLQEYADFSSKQAQILENEKNYKEAIEIAERLLADPSAENKSIENWSILRDTVRFSLMESYLGSGRTKEALAELDKIVLDRRQRYGVDHPLTRVARLRRAQILIRMGDEAAAERELVEMKPLYEQSEDRASDAAIGYHNTYGQILGIRGQEEQALEHFLKSLASVELVYGADSENAAVGHFNIAQSIAGSRSDRSEAYPHFLRAISVMEKIDRSDWRVGVMRLKLAQVHVMDGDDLSAKKALAPEHAADYFGGVPEPVRVEYMQALQAKFGRQRCGKSGTRPMGMRPDAIAHALVCRHDPDGAYAGTKWPFLEEE
jgi:eukaryotic-like serine/threonine-protein kinase